MVLDRMLRDDRLPAHLPLLRDVYRAKAAAMAHGLAAAGEKLSAPSPGGGLFFWLKLAADPQRVRDIDWFAFGRQYRVLVLPDSAFAADGASANGLRLSFASQPVEAIAIGVRRLLDGLDATGVLR